MLKKICFLSFSSKSHAESFRNFVKKPYFEPETCQIGPKVVIWTCPDLPRPVQEDKSLSAKQVFAFIFSEITPFHFVLANLSCFLSFSKQNHSESSRNFFQNQILNPKHAKSDQPSEIGHVRTCQDLSRRTNTFCKPAVIRLFFQKLHLSIFTKQIYHFL